jgi:hypothetical protein
MRNAMKTNKQAKKTTRTGRIVEVLETKENAADRAMQAAFRYSLVLLKGEEAIAHFNTMDECTTLVKAMVKKNEKWYVRDNHSGLQMAMSFGNENDGVLRHTSGSGY